MNGVVIPYPIVELEKLAFDSGIDDITWYPDPRCPRGKYKFTNGLHVIYINPKYRNDEIRYRCVLAHEYMHFANRAGVEIIDGELRDEAKARRAARKLLMPDWWIVPRLHLPVWEIAEQAGVYQEWAAARIRDMERMLVYA